MLSKVKYVKQQNIENPNNGKRNANLDKVLIYRTAIRQVANDVKKSRIKCRKQQSIRTLSYQYDTIVFISCQAIKTKKRTTNIAFGTLHKYH